MRNAEYSELRLLWASFIPLAACALLLPYDTRLEAAELPASRLLMTISAPSVPPGAVAQVRIAPASPRRISSGSVVMDFDPAAFGPVIAVDVFSAAGDQYGVAKIEGLRVNVQFHSDSGGIGRLPGIPMLTDSGGRSSYFSRG